MLYITHWSSSSSSPSSGFIKIFTCFQNETKVHRHLSASRGGVGCIRLPFGWRCHTKSSHAEHGWIVKSFHPERRSLLHPMSLIPSVLTRQGYITFSKSCKDLMMLSSWKQWEYTFKHWHWQAQLETAQERPKSCYSRQLPCFHHAFHPWWAGVASGIRSWFSKANMSFL